LAGDNELGNLRRSVASICHLRIGIFLSCRCYFGRPLASFLDSHCHALEWETLQLDAFTPPLPM